MADYFAWFKAETHLNLTHYFLKQHLFLCSSIKCFLISEFVGVWIRNKPKTQFKSSTCSIASHILSLSLLLTLSVISGWWPRVNSSVSLRCISVSQGGLAGGHAWRIRRREIVQFKPGWAWIHFCLFFYWEWSRTAIFKWGCWKCISLSSVLFGLVGLPVDSLIACNLLTVRSTAVSGNYASGAVELLCVLKYALRIDQVVLCFPLLRRKLRSKLVDVFHSTFPLIA